MLRWSVFCSLLVPLAAWTAPNQPVESVDSSKVLLAIASKCRGAAAYSFEGELMLDGQRGPNPGRVISKAKVKLAVAPGGKSLLHLQPVDKDEYLLVSDGSKSWAYVPRLKQYTETEGGTVVLEGRGEEDSPGGSSDERDLAETFSWLVMELLGKAAKTAGSIGAREPEQVSYEGRKYSWPVVQAMTRKTEEGQELTEITVDPETLRIGRLVWATVTYRDSERTVVRLTVNFNSLRVGEPVPDSTFSFVPPNKSKLVDAVPIPGQTGSFLLNKPAPDFEAKTLDGRKVKLSDFRDSTVLLNFWASWCGPCRRELPSIAKLHDEMKGQGLVVLGVNDEGKGEAQAFASKMGLPFPTLDDSALKLHRLFRVSSVPSIFTIGRDGKVVRFLRGAHAEAELRAALKASG